MPNTRTWEFEKGDFVKSYDHVDTETGVFLKTYTGKITALTYSNSNDLVTYGLVVEGEGHFHQVPELALHLVKKGKKESK